MARVRESSFAKTSTELTWDIVERPVYDINDMGEIVSIPNHKSIRRNDTNELLSIKPDSYHPMTNERFLEIAYKLNEISGFEITNFSEYKNGRTVLGYLKNNSETEIKIGNHKIEDYMLIGNSFDGTNSFFTGTVTELLRCSNQFGKITKMSKVRHTKNSEIKVEQLLNEIQFYFSHRDKMYSAFNRFGERIVSDEIIQKGLNHILDIKSDEVVSGMKLAKMERLISLIEQESKDVGDNLWGFFNGITYFTTHEIKSKDKIFGNVFGVADKLNQKAYDFCLSEM